MKHLLNRSSLHVVVLTLLIGIFSHSVVYAQQTFTGEFREDNAFGGYKQYSLTLNQGDTLQLTLSSGIAVRIGGAVYSPSGQLLSEFSPGSPASIVASANGNYPIEIFWDLQTEIISHEVPLDCIPDPLGGGPSCDDGLEYEEVEVSIGFTVGYEIVTVSGAAPVVQPNTASSAAPSTSSSSGGSGFLSSWMDEGFYALAAAEYWGMLESDPGDNYARAEAALAFFHSNDTESALEALAYLIENAPEIDNVYWTRGVMYLILEEPALALADFQQDSGAHFYIGLSHLALGDYEAAVQELEAGQAALASSGSESPIVDFWMGIAYVLNGDRDLAVAALQKGISYIDANPDDGLSLSAAPLYYILQGEPSESERIYRDGILKTEPYAHQHLLDRAYLYVMAQVLSGETGEHAVIVRDWFDAQIYGTGTEDLSALPVLGGTSGVNLVVNPGAEQSSGGELVGWESVAGFWTGDVFVSPPEGSLHFFAGQGDYAELVQLVDVSSYASDIDSGTMTFTFRAQATAYLSFAQTDAAQIVVEYIDNTGAILAVFDTGEQFYERGWEIISDSRLAPSGTRAVRIRLISVRYGGFDNDGYFDDISLVAEAA